MSGMWHRTLVYLGLKEEPEEGYDELPDRHAMAGDAGRPPEQRVDGFTPDERGDVTVRPLRPADEEGEPVTGLRAAVVEITDFEDVEAVGARYRTGQPVLFDTAPADAQTARRVVDFVSGMTYAMRGDLRKVASRAFLLVPDGVTLQADERRRLAGLGYRVGTGSES